jgi:NTP pyrophosphatase (non-canonical NTP hydrolase)
LSEIPSAIRNARAGLKLMLIVSEIGEALEAVRKNLGPDDHIPQFSAEEAEIADAVIRLMNYATDRDLRLAEALIEKNEYNRNRPDHTDRTGEHAKKF